MSALASSASTLVTWRQRTWLIVLGAATLLFLVIPMLIIVPMSFSGARFLQFPPETWSLRWYRHYAADSGWMEATRTSLFAAVATTLIATPIGIAAAYGIFNASARVARHMQLWLLAPLMVPHIITAIGVFFVFARMGLVGTLLGLVLAHVMLALPFVIISTLAGLRSYDMSQEMVARSLGMNRLRAFWHVTWPQIRPSVLSGTLFAFITSLDEAVVSLFISAGPNATLTKRMFTSLQDEIDPTIAAISSLLIVTTLVAFMITTRFGRRQAAA